MSGEVQVRAETLPVVPSAPAHLPVLPALPPLRREMRGPLRFGLAIIFAFFVVGGGWAAMAPISGAAIAPGSISPESSRQKIQHLEGGIIREIRVKEGDKVQAGDVLVVLAGVGAEAEAGQLTKRLQSLAATEARLDAERTNSKAIDFSHPSLSDRSDPDVQDAIQQQVNQFTARKENDQSQQAILAQRVAQLQQQIVGAEKQLVSVRRQNELIHEEIVVVKDMYEKGYEKKSRLLALQRTEADLLGQEGQLLSQVARSKEQIGETELQVANVKIKRKEDIDQQLSETQARRFETEQQLKEALDRMARSTIMAPVSGTVLDVKFKTTGGVIRPGEEVMTIVPDKDNLVIDAKVSTHDIDDVHAGQHAYVIFPSFSQRNLHRIDARVRFVSADAFEDERTQQHYYTAKIEIDREQLKRLDPNVELTPGMPAEAFITTKDRTLLDYIIQPYMLVIEHSFRER
ncbi:MAG: HlyD family type I secretion periplasmic adaptor subunit [Rhodospirillales bacterium]|nr:HlyD family type I secretion periplasmic adaptor subunit [Rhodospirillales bacterium]